MIGRRHIAIGLHAAAAVLIGLAVPLAPLGLGPDGPQKQESRHVR